MKLSYTMVWIEVTRKCNLVCAHCLRGNAQEVDINLEDIDLFLDQTDLIYHLVITGGEPMLNLRAIQYILYGMIKRGIPLLKLSIVTNGSIYSQEIIDTICAYNELIKTSKQFYDEPTDEEIEIENLSITKMVKIINPSKYDSYVEQMKSLRDKTDIHIGVSIDDYHKCDCANDNYNRYKTALEGIADVKIHSDGNYYSRTGRAKDLDAGINTDYIETVYKNQRIEIQTSDQHPKCGLNTKLSYQDQKLVLCGVYLTAKGEIASAFIGGNLDYDCIDRNTICSVKDDIWESLQKYNRVRLSCEYCSDCLYKMSSYSKTELDFMTSVNKKDAYNNLCKNDPAFLNYPKWYQNILVYGATQMFKLSCEANGKFNLRSDK